MRMDSKEIDGYKVIDIKCCDFCKHVHADYDDIYFCGHKKHRRLDRHTLSGYAYPYVDRYGFCPLFVGLEE